MSSVVNSRNSPFLSENFGPIDDEISLDNLSIEGTIPKALQGTYMRNGPNLRFEPLGDYHWFDGDGMLHAVDLSDGKARYRNRWIQSAGLQAEEKLGRAIFGGFNDSKVTQSPEARQAGGMKNLANTNIIRHADKILACWEAGLPTQMNADLTTAGPYDFDGKLQGPMTAHPKVDPATGELLFFGYIPGLRYYEADANGSITRSVAIELPRPVMIHDFAFTKNHVIFMDAPAVMDYESMMRGGPLVSWQPECGTRIGVLPRGNGGDAVQWFEVPNGYVVHFMNAFEEGSSVIAYGCRFDTMDFGAGTTDVPDPVAFLTRYEMNLETGEVRETQAADIRGEFPRVAPDREGQDFEIGYFTTFTRGEPDGPRFDSISRFERSNGEVRTHQLPGHQITGEAVFAPDPQARGEDEGWLISFVSNPDGSENDLLILDAQTLRQQARVHMPRRVPFGFHGNWFASA